MLVLISGRKRGCGSKNVFHSAIYLKVCSRSRCLKSRLTVLRDEVLRVNPSSKIVSTRSGRSIRYGRLCLCHGASPRLPTEAARSRNVRVIRDTESVRDLQVQNRRARLATITSFTVFKTVLGVQAK